MSDDWDDTRDTHETCPNCIGDGEVPCHCGGDLCICENYGDAPCPTCHGEGEVTHERAERYMAAQREFAEQMRKLWADKP